MSDTNTAAPSEAAQPDADDKDNLTIAYMVGYSDGVDAGIKRARQGLQALVEKWQHLSREALPTDAMLINKHTRELSAIIGSAPQPARAEDIDPLLVETIQRGQMAFVRMKDRYLRGLALGFDAQGLQDAPEALDALQVMVDASSPAQMILAIKEAYRRISNGDLLEVKP